VHPGSQDILQTVLDAHPQAASSSRTLPPLHRKLLLVSPLFPASQSRPRHLPQVKPKGGLLRISQPPSSPHPRPKLSGAQGTAAPGRRGPEGQRRSRIARPRGHAPAAHLPKTHITAREDDEGMSRGTKGKLVRVSAERGRGGGEEGKGANYEAGRSCVTSKYDVERSYR